MDTEREPVNEVRRNTCLMTQSRLHTSFESFMGIRIVVQTLSEAGPGAPSTFEFEQGRISIGRDRGCDVLLPHPSVSGHHATLLCQTRGNFIVDENSSNGVRLDNEAIPPTCERRLSNGSRLQVGAFLLEVSFRAVSEMTSVDGTAAIARKLAFELFKEEVDEHASPLPSMMIESTRERLELSPSIRYLIGRDPACDLTLADEDASRRHCSLHLHQEGALMHDEGSKNGTLVNGKRVQRARLVHEDEIVVGTTRLIFLDPGQALVAKIAQMEADEPLSTSLDMLIPDDVFESEPPNADPNVEPITNDRGEEPKVIVDGLSEHDEAAGENVEVSQSQAADASKSSPTQNQSSASGLEPPNMKPTRRKKRVRFDLLVILFSVLVVAASVGGMVWLLQSSQ